MYTKKVVFPGNGLFLQCTNEDPPTYTNRIDWSAVPEGTFHFLMA